MILMLLEVPIRCAGFHHGQAGFQIPDAARCAFTLTSSPTMDFSMSLTSSSVGAAGAKPMDVLMRNRLDFGDLGNHLDLILGEVVVFKDYLGDDAIAAAMVTMRSSLP